MHTKQKVKKSGRMLLRLLFIQSFLFSPPQQSDTQDRVKSLSFEMNKKSFFRGYESITSYYKQEDDEGPHMKKRPNGRSTYNATVCMNTTKNQGNKVVKKVFSKEKAG